MAETSEKLERLKREKKNAKTRLTRRKNKLNEMISEKSASKNGIKRYINSIKSEFDIIEKLLNNLKELYIFDNVEESEVEVARLDKEIEEIGEQVDVIIEAAETHLRDRVEQGESESVDHSEDWGKSTKGYGSLQSEYEYQQQSDIDEANRRITKLQEEERRKEEELCQKRVELELAKQRTNEARKIASIIDARSQISSPSNIVNDTDDTCSPSLLQQALHPSNPSLETHPTELPHRVPDPSNPPLETHPSELQRQVPIPSIPSPYPVPNLDLRYQQVQNPVEPNSRKTPTHFPQHPVPDSELSDHNNSFRGNPGEHLQPNRIPTPDSQHPNIEVNRTGYIPAQSSHFPLTYPPSPTLTSSNIQTPQGVAPIKLKGVDLPVFDGEDKTEYEQWKAAFMSAVDQTNIPVNEKMLRLQSSLKGNALKLVKDLGFTVHAYDRAKEKLEKKYGGQRRLRIKTLTVLKNWKKLQQNNLKDLEEFLNVLDRTLIVLKDSCDSKGDLLGQSLNLTSKEKLPEEDVQRYKAWLLEHSKEDTFETLVEWVELRVQIMEEAKEETSGLGTSKFEKNNGILRRRRERNFNSGFKDMKCVVPTCKGNHPPWACDEFKALPVSNRKALIDKSKRCFKCLAIGHRAAKCNRARRCGVDGCDSCQHNRLLHITSDNQQIPRVEIPNTRQNNNPQDGTRGPQISEGNGTTRSYVSQRTDRISLMVLPAVIRNGERKLKVNIMLDPCSTGSYVTEVAAQELQLKGEIQDLTISGTGGTQVQKHSKQVNLVVSSLDGKFSDHLSANVLDNITGDTPAFNWAEMKDKWPHLAPIPFGRSARRRQIDVLIGSDHPLYHQVFEEVRGSKSTDPIGRLTQLGWVCFGPIMVEQHRRKSSSHFTRTYRSHHVEQSRVQQQDDQLRQFWELEALGITDNQDHRTPDEKEAIAKVTESMIYDEGRYAVGIPWRRGEPKLENNYDLAFERLKSQEKALRRRGSEAMQAYDKIIEDYERKGYIKKVPANKDTDQWFLPHFAVIKEDRTTTKTRIVFDAAAKSCGKSLNDAIYPGPKLQKDLLNVLMRFRRAPVALSGDISEMFLQVSLLKNDRPYHRFLWRNFDASQEPSVYEFQRLVFGNTASPFCAQFVIQNHAETKAADYPKAADTVSNSMYVDDVLDSGETPQEVIELRRQLSQMLTTANFHLRKWSSNDKSVLEDVPREDRQPDIEIRENGRPTGKLKTLGVTWKSENDVFTFNVQPPVLNERTTKREVLSSISMLFDPLQFLSPFTVTAKILMQDIWSAGLDWDDPLPRSLLNRWQQWVDELQRLSTFEVPRCLRQPSPVEMQLHMFSDASQAAYAACGYLMCRYQDGTSTSVLISSKCRVAPVKAMSIPRLELMAAVISTRLATTILKSIEVSKVVFWTDSTNVLYWVKNQSRNFKTFVANRIGEIQKTTNPEQWRHVPGELNPADLATRGIKASELVDSRVWKAGPEFLLKSEISWPTRLAGTDELQSEATEERKMERTHAAQISDEFGLNPRNFSSFYRLVRVTAWVRRFVTNCKQKVDQRILTANFTANEVKQAEVFWFKNAQTESFQNDKGKKSLENLNPMKDIDGLLRINGRLRHADLPYESRHPIILPNPHPVTKLVVQSVHEQLGHGIGVEHTLCELRSKFWVIKGRRLVRDILHHCQACKKRFTAKPIGQMMAPLPRQRVTSSMKAFDRVGVDYGGPYLTKQGRGKTRAKRYLCLFTCLVTRAVHLELAYSLDTDSFMNAFDRMISRRGTPSYVISDNGTNFVAGERELRELIEKLNQEKIVRDSSRFSQIEWHFNPPAGPHFGGVFEIMIKSAKKAIKSILGDAEVSDEELHTAICGAEKLLNSRPITYVSSDSNDLCPLTPNHFIHGQLGGKFAVEASNEEMLDPRKRWHRVQQLINQVWKRWRKELLPTLNRRKKWFHPTRNIKEGDVVLMIEPNANRSDWPLGRIVETFPGDDGLVRVVRLKARGKEYIRPVHRLCPLEYV